MLEMRIVHDVPPLFDEINARFNVEGKSVLFAWGDTIYNPQNGKVDAPLLAHEAAHGIRQGKDIEGWWHRYIEDADFRLDEEVFAHRAEYMARAMGATNRHERRALVVLVAKRLASPLYDYRLSVGRAKRLIKGE